MVLDGPPDHSIRMDRLVRLQAAEVEEQFQRFAAWCADTADCALHGQDVAAVYREVLDRAAGEGVPAPGLDHPLGVEEIAWLTAVFAWDGPDHPLGGGWPELDDAIAQARTGPAEGYALRYEEYAGRQFDVFRAVNCLDWDPQVRGYHELASLQRRVARVAPTMGGVSNAWDIMTGCLGWPVPPSNPQGPVPVRGIGPSIVVGSLHNGVWSYKLAERAAR